MIYLLHFTVPLTRSNGSVVNHYLGYTSEQGLAKRVALHNAGRSKAAIIRAAWQNGSRFRLVKTWPNGTRALERYLKTRGHLKVHCPDCAKAERARQAAKMREYRMLSSERLSKQSPPPETVNGGASPARSRGTATSDVGRSHQRRQPVPSTWCGATGSNLVPGGSSLAATVQPGSGKGRGYAGTKQRSTSAN